MEKRGKLDLNWGLDPFVRNSVWIGTFSLAITNLKIYTAQSAMMRFTVLKSINKAAMTIAVGALGYVALGLLCAAAAVVMIGYYSQIGCGPLGSGDIYSSNQVLAYFVITVLNYPGLPGLFVAAVVSSTLSSVSSVQNGLSAVTWQELLSRKFGHVTDARKTLILKLTVVVYGFLALCSAYFADVVGGTLFVLANASLSVLNGGPAGMFILGGAFPFVGASAAMIGSCIGMALTMWVSIGSLIYPPKWSSPQYIDDTCDAINGSMVDTTPYSTNIMLMNNYESTTAYSAPSSSDEHFSLTDMYSLSPYMYSTLCTGGCVLIGLLLSIFPCFRQQNKVSRMHVFPFARGFYNVKSKKEELETEGELDLKSRDQNKNESSLDSLAPPSQTLLYKTTL